MILDHEQLEDMIPYANDKLRDRFLSPLNKAMERFEINTPLRIAAFIAQVAHESGSLHYVEEIADGSAYEYRKDLGNLEPEALAAAHAQKTTTGRFYKGLGLLQITGFYNMRACGKALGLDLVNHPRLLTEPVNACRSAAWFWKSHGCNELADTGNFGRITKVINGGTNGATERLKLYSNCKKVLSC